MFQLDDIWEEATKIAGFCDEPKLLRWISDAFQLVAQKGDFDGQKGNLDICTTDGGTVITLPREVETVYAVNLGGQPTLGYNQLFSYHLNGPGDCQQALRSWQDLGFGFPVYRNPTTPEKLVAYPSSAADNGKSLLVFGYDENGNELRRETSDGWVAGYQVALIYGYSVPEAGAPKVARITAVQKVRTVGPLRLSTIDDSGVTGTLLAVYEPDEVFPQYRRIKVGQACQWVRISYRKINPVFLSRYDHVMLKNRMALLCAMHAMKFYSEKNLGAAQAYEANAARLEIEAQLASEPPTYSPVQVINTGNEILDTTDYDIR
jgi:hypothetical protein